MFQVEFEVRFSFLENIFGIFDPSLHGLLSAVDCNNSKLCWTWAYLGADLLESSKKFQYSLDSAAELEINKYTFPF